ncbi:hypothetical protein RUM43_002418 [Polyplax serrata]|uniref:Uncharacterized protein n=1 Tax=Polyplax serrata TaxID=468196 RepID=A0AAN8PCP2_POLSC
MEKNIYGPVDIIRSVTSGHVWPPPTITTWSRDSLTFHRDIMRRREESEKESWRLAWTHSNDFFLSNEFNESRRKRRRSRRRDTSRKTLGFYDTTRHHPNLAWSSPVFRDDV